MTAGDLFDALLLARKADPDTSHDAAASMEYVVGPQHQAILDTLGAYDQPMAAEQIADRTDTMDMVAVCRRLNELTKQGRITRTEIKHTNRSGRQAYCFTLNGG